MAISQKVLDVFKKIVGPENFSDDQCILDTYAFNWLAEAHPLFAPSKYGYRPPAVILPGTVEEVQAVVKACNLYDVKYKAHSTGYGIHAFPGIEDVLVIDLRRMNRILEIDEKNKAAVVEPYVNWAELGAEVMKYGLFTTPIQAGSQASVLANITSVWGVNTFGNHGGHNGRNVLGVEWIMPTGELIRLGSMDGWFCADGPGPSLRGLLRGHIGHMGGMGVITKAAIKLHNWPGPPSMETRVNPESIMKYELKTPVENVKLYNVCFADWEHLIDFLYKVGDAEISYALNRVGGLEHILCLLPEAEFIKKIYDTGMVEEAAKVFTYPVLAVVWGNSKREMEYFCKVMEKIIEETEGWVPPLLESLLENIDMESMGVHSMVANDTHFVFHSGGFIINAAYTCTPEAMVRHQGPGGEALKKKYIERGVIMNDGLDGLYHNSFEHNSYAYGEIEYHYDASDPEIVKGAMDLIKEEDDLAFETKCPIESCNAMVSLGSGPDHNDRIERLGNICQNFHKWQEKIKLEFDPKLLSDPSSFMVYRNNLVKAE